MKNLFSITLLFLITTLVSVETRAEMLGEVSENEVIAKQALVNNSNANISDENANDEGALPPLVIPAMNISNTVEEILPTVVSISTNGNRDIEYTKSDEKFSGAGSGFIISKDGYIVTNNHVIEGADEISVTLHATKESLNADVIGFDRTTDLALLKIKSPRELPYVSFNKSDDYKEGDWIIVVGNPFNLGVSVSTGIISAKNRNLGVGTLNNFIQTDAAINKGNSGGPMFNLSGEVIGINSAIFSPSGGNVGVGFAIPSSTILPIVQQIKKNGFVKRSWLGIYGQDVTKEMARALNMRSTYGVIVTDVQKNSPASLGGLNVSDVILYVDGEKINNVGDLHEIIMKTEIGSSQTIKVLRKGSVVKLKVDISESQEENNYNREYERIAGEAINFLGMKMAIIDNKTRNYFGLNTSAQGLYVIKVNEESVANYTGIHEGDIIETINQVKIQTKDEFNELIKDIDRHNRDYVLLLIKRSGSVIVETLPLKTNLITTTGLQQ